MPQPGEHVINQNECTALCDGVVGAVPSSRHMCTSHMSCHSARIFEEPCKRCPLRWQHDTQPLPSKERLTSKIKPALSTRHLKLDLNTSKCLPNGEITTMAERLFTQTASNVRENVIGSSPEKATAIK